MKVSDNTSKLGSASLAVGEVIKSRGAINSSDGAGSYFNIQSSGEGGTWAAIEIGGTP